MRNKQLRFLIPLMVSMTSYWFWRILHASVFVGVGILLLSVLIFTVNRKLKYFSWTLLTVFVLLSVFVLKTQFDKSVFIKSDLEKTQLLIRGEFMAKGFGKLYENRIGLFLFNDFGTSLAKFDRNIFDNLDPNIYFAVGHPRERGYAEEFPKFSLFLVPFFTLGLIIILGRFNKYELYFLLLTSVVSAFVDPGYSLGSILFFPIVVYVISLGVEKTVIYFKYND